MRQPAHDRAFFPGFDPNPKTPMANYYLEHRSGTYYLLQENQKEHLATFPTQEAGIEYAKKHHPPPQNSLHVERVEDRKAGQPPLWRKIH